MSAFIAPGATLGVMGGGQLARMFVHAAQQLGYMTVVLDPDPASPAGQVAHHHIQADYQDRAGLAQLAQLCDAVTTEFENVPAQALSWLAEQRPVSPSAAAVAVCQDRVAEKAHFMHSGVACAPHSVITSSEDLKAIDTNLLPGILKTARLGYDGKGQIRVNTPAELAHAWHQLGTSICVLEKMLPLAAEISVIVARGLDGTTVHLPVQQNLHQNGILAMTQVPTVNISVAIQQRASSAAVQIAQQLSYVGVLCVEFFVLQDGSLVVNEMAPRPHNSGHYSLDACDTSQFQLQVRAMTRAPLLTPRLHSPCVMLNLLGELWGAASEKIPRWEDVLELPGAHLHLYGKTQARVGRKMGHLTVTAPTPEQAMSVAREAALCLKLPPF
jgi:5-(carboxyamino)imidazole ribonucleotide synthase